MNVRVLLIGGYDEALKGAVIAEAASNFATLSPESYLLVIRDHYEAIKGIDDLGINVAVEFLTGGCFCCSMKHDFELLLIERVRKEGTCNFIVEVPLTAELETVKDSIRDVIGGNTLVTTTFAIDPSIAGVMMETFPGLMSRSLRSSDVLAIRREEESKINKLAVLGSEWELFIESDDVGQGFDDGCELIFLSKRSFE